MAKRKSVLLNPFYGGLRLRLTHYKLLLSLVEKGRQKTNPPYALLLQCLHLGRYHDDHKI